MYQPYPQSPKYRKINNPKDLMDCTNSHPEMVFYGYWMLYNPKTDCDEIHISRPNPVDNPAYDWESEDDSGIEPRRFYPHYNLEKVYENGCVKMISDKLEYEFWERVFQPGEIIYCKTLDDCKRVERIINKLKRSDDLCVKLNQNIIAIEVEAV